ncbi:MAG: TIGR01777 family oxidoreductase [Thermoguttaceae bacterium]|jgi:uncharacterized protein (TIGR01777 family)
MKTELFSRRSILPVAIEAAFAWHTRPGALERLLPPWEKVQLLKRTGGIQDGDRVELRVHVGPLPVTWIAEHRDYQPNRQFRDVQIQGPFAAWDHLHRFEPEGPDASVLEDRIEYALPAGIVGQWAGQGTVRRRLEQMFQYRHATTIADLAAHAKYQGEPLEVCLSGSSGLIGSTLASFLRSGGHGVRRIVRKEPDGDPNVIAWDSAHGTLEAEKLEGADAVVHLAGESIASGRWTEAKRTRIRESRVQGTRELAAALSRLQTPPKVLIVASAIGYYGNRGDAMLDEDAGPGRGFLAEVCQQWEAAVEPAAEHGIRVVHARFGIVLSPHGGALAKMLPLVRLGLGGRLGDGQQYWSWVSLDDVVGAIHHAIITPTLTGPMNVTTPNPVQNVEFTKTLARILGRPAILPAPAAALRLALGDMADEMLLASTRAIPHRLFAAGYEFRHPTIDAALRHLLGRA